MPARRHFGSVRRLSSGRWQARYRTDDGRMASGGTLPTRRDAERWLAGVETDLARGEHEPPGTATVGELARCWLETVAPGQARSEQTIEHYRGIVELHLIPALGEVAVGELSAAQVDDWLASRAHLARSYVGRMRSTLAQILRDAQRRGVVRSNAAALAVVPPAKAPAGRRSLSVAEAQAFIAAAEAEPLGAMFSVGLCLGLRPGELAGLLWEDVDLDADPTQTRRRCRSPARSSAARTTRCGGTPSPSAPRPRAAPWPFPLSRRLRWRSARRPAGPASAWSSPRPRATRSTPATSTRCLRGSPAVRGSKAASPT